MQSLLFPDARPLVERLGSDFFRQLPSSPGVYLMRDRQGAILYVGKAKNLRQRLGSYRVANPDRVPRRLIRLLNSVVHIEHQQCEDEAAALRREGELLRELKPRFNRAGVWAPPPKVLGWRRTKDGMELAVLEMPQEGWQTHGPLKGGSGVMLPVLVRLLWAVSLPERGLAGMPAGWFHGRIPCPIHLPHEGVLVESTLTMLLRSPEEGVAALLEAVSQTYSGWQLEVLTADVEFLTQYFTVRRPVS